MRGLSSSRHAPSTWRQSTTHSPRSTPPPLTITPAPTGSSNANANTNANGRISPHPHEFAAHELSRYTKIVRRLKWKLPFLSTAYQHAVDRLGRDPALVAEAELMFKLDFFEYYMLVERALVHLQGVFGVSISRGSPRAGAGLAGSVWRGGTSSNNDDTKNVAEHRYHANVLAALDSPENPLHAILGVGEVRRQLSRAKDLRNRWKTAAEEHDEAAAAAGEKHGAGGVGSSSRARSPNGRTPKVPAPLETYNLEHILATIFDGFDAAFLVAEQHVRGGSNESVDLEMTEEQQWEFMVDAMDWEAV